MALYSGDDWVWLRGDLKAASVILEKHIGWRDDSVKEGGRIDIYILDDGRTISIEK
ncbi:MAG: hypothetical protein U0176_07330 [Bacteroidia bacterium]